MIATAILDRLPRHSTTINIRGESYRPKDRRKAGLFLRADQDSGRAAPDGRPWAHLWVGEFSKGTMGNFQPELTVLKVWLPE
jgi:hypothetical protein